MNILSNFQLPSSSGLGLSVFGRYFDYRIPDSVNESINDGGDCRTAPATPGLLIIEIQYFLKQKVFLMPLKTKILTVSILYFICGRERHLSTGK